MNSKVPAARSKTSVPGSGTGDGRVEFKEISVTEVVNHV